MGSFLFLILFLVGCQKNQTESDVDSKSSQPGAKRDLLVRVKEFATRIKTKKAGQLESRTGDPLPLEDANDLVEGTMNYNYCDASILHWETTIDDTTIVVATTDDLISEEDVDEFYDNVVVFAGYRFNQIEDEDKTPRAYDIEITATGANTVTFKITSIVGNSTIYSPWSRRTFGSGSYEAMYNVENFCGSPNRDGPTLMAEFINYNLRYPYYHYFLLLSTGPGNTDDTHDPFAWRFTCQGNTSCATCTSCDCSSFTLADEYCRTQTQMNDDLDEAEAKFTASSPYWWMQYGRHLVTIKSMVPSRECTSNGGDRKDNWLFEYTRGTRHYETHNRLFF